MKKILAFILLSSAPLYGDDTYVDFRALKPSINLTMAQAALERCRAAGYQIGVMVTDRFGIPQVFLRDQYAGIHVFETTQRKAWTAVTFRTATGELSELTAAGTELAGLRNLSKAMMVGGGLPVLDGEGSLVAGIGVSGAPGGDEDENCAAAGIAAIEDDIAF
tara:strand:+ start:315 stop:803 length:489 start_codon:yes stop_codon:yes gene_type:complete